MAFEEKIRTFLNREDYEPMTKEDLSLAMEVSIDDLRPFFETLVKMERRGSIILSKKNKIYLPEMHPDYTTGRLMRTARGGAFVSGENGDIYISPENIKDAMHKDVVLVRNMSAMHGKRAEGVVSRIMERSGETIVGTYHEKDGKGYVDADDVRAFYRIEIPKEKTLGAKEDDKVVVRLYRFPTKKHGPIGEILAVLGNKNEIGMDILSIIYQYEIPMEFSDEALAEAKEIPLTVTEKDKKGRVDLRALFTVTIDGADAKDFDDAISIERDGENTVLYVHIADVAHYVPENSALDRDARVRGNSVYLVDRVIPMLPFELSNGICSLLPGEERLTKTAKIVLDRRAEILSYELMESVILSDKRLVYDDVSNYLEGKEHPFANEEELCEALDLMKDLAKKLEEKRYRRGSLEFEFPETTIVVDPKGKPTEIKETERRIANDIIEEFMILANEVVAEHFMRLDAPFLYRIHEEPSGKKLDEFKSILAIFDYKVDGGVVSAKKYRKILEASKGTKEEHIIHTLLLKSLKKARYSPVAEGHFGLASSHYCHFTAPIRRYADVFVHRVLHEWLAKRPFSWKKRLSELESLADHISTTELKADLCERDVDDLKKAEYMMDYIGTRFEGIVSSLNSFGFFVELPNTIEGLVHFRNLDDFYTFDESRYVIRGERNGDLIELGDPVTVEVADVNLTERTIDFKWIRDKKNKKTVKTNKKTAEKKQESTAKKKPETKKRILKKSGKRRDKRKGKKKA